MVGDGLRLRSSWARSAGAVGSRRLGVMASVLRPASPPRATNPIMRWFVGGNPMGEAAGLGIATAVAVTIAAAAGSATGGSSVTGASIPPLTIGKAAVIQLSYRNAANPLTGTLVAGGADLSVSAVDSTTDQLTVTAHPFFDYSGDGPGIWDTASGGTVPTGLTNGASYWTGIVDANTLKLATSDVNAATGSWVNITANGSGTHTLKRAQNTQNRDSLILAAAIRGDWDNTPSAPYDNKGNTFTTIDAGPYSYSAWPTAKMGVFSSVVTGGLDHRLYLDWGPYTPAGAEADEVTLGWVEINGPAMIEASSYKEVTTPAASMTSDSVTISKAATLLCIVGGSAGLGQQHVFTFGGGYTKIAAASAEAEISANGYCQLSMGYLSVDPGGTPTAYTCTVNGTSNEVGKIWLIAITSPNIGNASGSSTVAGVGGSVAASTGTASGVGAADAGGTAVTAAAGSAAGVGAASAAASSGDGAGAAAGTGAATATGTAIYSSAGSAAGVGDAAAVGAATSAADGAAAGTGTPTATGASTAASSGSAAGAATPTATGAATASAAGASSGAATVAATGGATSAAAGASAGAASATGAGASTAAGQGFAAGASSVAATGASVAAGAGAASGLAAATGAGASVAAAAGAAAGTSTASGSADAGLAVGSAAGASAADAPATAIASAVGSASGSGSADALATSIAAAVGSASGQGDATAIGAGMAAAAGDAAGASTVDGVQSSEPLPHGARVTRSTAPAPRLTRTTPPTEPTRTTTGRRPTRTT